SLGDGVEHGRKCWPEPGEFLKFLVAQVRTDSETHADVLESVAHARVRSQEPPQIDVALDRRLYFLDLDPPGSSVIDHGRGHARGESLEQVFSCVRSLVAAQKHRVLVCVEYKRLGTLNVLHGSVKSVDGRAVMGSIEPLAFQVETKLCDHRVGFHGFN